MDPETKEKRWRAKFWLRVNKNGPIAPRMKSSCWLWMGPPTRRGYGRTYFRGKKWHAHRQAWVYAHGMIPKDKQVLHRCDVRLCVRHLFLGTNKTNQADKARKRRSTWGERNPKAKILDKDVAKVFTLRKRGLTQREIGDIVGVTQSQVSNILLRKQRK